MQEEETQNSPDMSKYGWNHSTPRLLEVLDFPRCNNAGMRMSIDWPLVDSKVEMLPEVCKEDANLEPTFPMRDSWLPH